MLRIIAAAFLILHGAVHMLYSGQSRGLFELQPGLLWPQESWLFSRLLTVETTRILAGISCALAALGFLAAGVGLLAAEGWWRPMVIGSAAFSMLLFLLFWGGTMDRLADNGAVGLLISGALLLAALLLRWPGLEI